METLKPYERKHFSQQGEDGVIEEMALRVFDGDIKNRHIFEFGASTGMECNSHYFFREHGWYATLIESDFKTYRFLSEFTKSSVKVNALCVTVTPENIQSLIDQAEREVDVLSVDIDGQDYWVWEAVTSSPKIVVVEYNADLKGRLAIAKGLDIPFNGTTAYGASLDAYISLGKKKGYTLVHTESNGVNAFFVRDDLCHLFPEKDAPQLITENKTNFMHTNEDVFVEV